MGIPGYHIPTDSTIAEKARALITADLSHPWLLPALAAECGVSHFKQWLSSRRNKK